MKTTISIIIPVYSGENYLERLIDRISKIKKDWELKKYPIEILEVILVDDDSKDGSQEILKNIENIQWVNVITLAKNYGQHPATVAGISYSSGDWVVTLDEDLQHEPENIINMLKLAIENSLDVVYVNSNEAVHKSIFRDMSSKYYKKLIKKITGNPYVSNFNSFRLIRGTIARNAAAVVGHESYFDIVLSWFTNKVSVFKTTLRDERYIETGNSGYNFKRLLSHARRMLMTSDAKVLRGASYLGFVLFVFCGLLSLYFLLEKIFNPESVLIAGWASQVVILLVVSSIIFMILGVISEYIFSLIKESNGKPTYSVVNRDKDLLISDFLKGLDFVYTKKDE